MAEGTPERLSRYLNTDRNIYITRCSLDVITVVKTCIGINKGGFKITSFRIIPCHSVCRNFHVDVVRM